jgi:RHS repeat-associated protein
VLGHVYTKDGTDSTYFVRQPTSDHLVATRDAGGSHYYMQDGLGNVIGLTNSSGTQVASYSYDPYGDHETATGTYAATNPYRYKEGHKDNTGLYKFGARYYSPGTGRWTQQDPAFGQMAVPGLDNPYQFVAGDPVNRSDRSGHNSVSDWFSDNYESLIAQGEDLTDCVDQGLEFGEYGALAGFYAAVATGQVEAIPAGFLIGFNLGCAFAVI